MIKSIIVPTDFSACSINALKYAASFARHMEIENFSIMHAMPTTITYSEMGVGTAATDHLFEHEEEVENEFFSLKKKVPELRHIKYKTVIQQGSVVDAVSAHCDDASEDLIIMGTKGATGLDEIIMGTNTHAVVQESKCPVLVIPENVKYRHIDNIALASDYKSIDSSVLNPLKQINWKFGSQVHLIHVGEEPHLKLSKAEQAKKFEYYLKNVPHEYHYIMADDIEKGIESYIKKHQIDLLTLIPRKHKFFEMMFEGGESKKIIYHTKIPLLAIPE
ncbi:MAG: universal stress protein [Fulvivirga sp.]|nr:universal stress protein [Fulvivirga sp.]